MRKLASVQEILNIEPILNADALEKATILGWSVVVKKNEFKKGDKCVFFEIDSILPSDVPWSQFMAPRNFKVKTAKLRGCLSQGLAFPMSILDKDYEIGTDLTEVLNVGKWEATPLVSHAEQLGPFPNFIPKTDETRIQNHPILAKYIEDKEIFITEKMDGMSGTFFKKDGVLRVCGRNYELRDGDNPHWNVSRKYEMDKNLPEDFCIQGEVCGPGIQKNKLELKQFDFFVFNVFNFKTGTFLNFKEFVDFCETNKFKTVPIVESILNPKIEYKDWFEKAKGLYKGTNNPREGIVIRTTTEQYCDILQGRMSFKVINNDFLLKEKD